MQEDQKRFLSCLSEKSSIKFRSIGLWLVRRLFIDLYWICWSRWSCSRFCGSWRSIRQWGDQSTDCSSRIMLSVWFVFLGGEVSSWGDIWRRCMWLWRSSWPVKEISHKVTMFASQFRMIGCYLLRQDLSMFIIIITFIITYCYSYIMFQSICIMNRRINSISSFRSTT